MALHVVYRAVIGWPTPSETLGKCGNKRKLHFYLVGNVLCPYIWAINEQEHAMNAVELTPENIARIEGLKKVHHSNWNGNTIHRNLEACLAAINLESSNSGWYKPKAVTIDGLSGIYMLNSDGTIYYDSRVKKEGSEQYRIEHLIGIGFRQFEQAYSLALSK